MNGEAREGGCFDSRAAGPGPAGRVEGEIDPEEIMRKASRYARDDAAAAFDDAYAASPGCGSTRSSTRANFAMRSALLDACCGQSYQLKGEFGRARRHHSTRRVVSFLEFLRDVFGVEAADVDEDGD